MIPISFDIYFKVIGSIGLLSLLPQITSIFKMFDELQKCKIGIEKQRQIDPHTERPIKFHKDIENGIKRVENMKPFLCNFIIVFALSVFSTIIYAICKDIPCLSDKNWYQNFIAIISFVFFIGIPIYFTFVIYFFYNLYYRMIHYSSLNEIYKFNRK